MTVATRATAALAAIAPHDDPQWFADRRAEATERLRTGGFPAAGDAAWKGSDMAALTEHTTIAAPGDVSDDDLAPFLLADVDQRIVLVDGAYRPDLSRLDLPHRVHFEPLGEAISNGSAVLKEHLDRTAHPDSFSDWNSAAWTDGVFLTTAEDTVFHDPIHILHVRTPQADTVCFPRVLIHLQGGSHITVIEHHVGLADANTSTVAVTELVAHNGSTIHHDRIQQEWTSAHHVHTIRVRADRDATIHAGSAGLGAAHSRVTVDGVLSGEGGHLDLPGLFLAGGTRRVDFWSRFDHAVPHTTSRELVKGVLGDAARGSFTGEVIVRRDAQKTSAQQENRNLLLSRKALMDSKPQLQIEADDVQCSHGSTIGRLDEAALFFLRSRGIGQEAAKVMLTKAFLGEAIGRMHPSTHPYLNRQVDAWFERHPQTIEVLT